MDPLNRRFIEANEIAERLVEHMEDFYSDGIITASTLRKKLTFLTMLRAINHAERVVMRNSQTEGQVVVYAPAGEHNVLLNDQKKFQGEIVTDLQAQTDKDDAIRQYFMVKDTHLKILEITSRYLDAFDDYPASGETSESRIRKVSQAEYNQFDDRRITNPSTFYGTFYGDPLIDNVCYYLQGENRLVLGVAMTSASFLQFTARLMPGIVSVQDYDKIGNIPITGRDCLEFEKYKMMASMEAFEWIIYEALLYLLPLSSKVARDIVKLDRNEERSNYLTTKPTDRNVIVPDISFG